ncbi:MAG: hypothetical protein HQK52_14625 [Oligoflexia bacterium]|nr:hypothetical protein [Oligoflexia bacterium]
MRSTKCLTLLLSIFFMGISFNSWSLDYSSENDRWRFVSNGAFYNLQICLESGSANGHCRWENVDTNILKKMANNPHPAPSALDALNKFSTLTGIKTKDLPDFCQTLQHPTVSFGDIRRFIDFQKNKQLVSHAIPSAFAAVKQGTAPCPVITIPSPSEFDRKSIVDTAKKNGFIVNAEQRPAAEGESVINPSVIKLGKALGIDLGIKNGKKIHMTLVSFNKGIPNGVEGLVTKAVENFVKAKGNATGEITYDLSDRWGANSHFVKGDLELLGLYVRNELVKRGIPLNDPLQRLFHVTK